MATTITVDNLTIAEKLVSAAVDAKDILVDNKSIKEALKKADELGNIDTELNPTSTHALTNAAITSKFNTVDAAISTKISSSYVGVASGIAPLDLMAKVPTEYLPSYVDDVIEGYYNNGVFYKDAEHKIMIQPESGKIYVDLVTNKTYRWSGSQYTVISETLALGETADTAYAGNKGKANAESIEQLKDSKVDKVDGKGLSTNDYTTDEKTKLESLHNYDDTEVRALIAGKEDADPNHIVKYFDFGQGRKTIQLANHNTISGISTGGTGHNLVMLSKWDVADFGAVGVHMNLNTKDAVSINDTDVVATDKDLLTKVDKVDGKGLSTNDYTTAEKTKLAELQPFDPSTLDERFNAKLDKREDVQSLNELFKGINCGEVTELSQLTAIVNQMLSRFGGNVNHVTVNTEEELKTALQNAVTLNMATYIKLNTDINLDTLTGFEIPTLSKSFTLDLQGHTIKSRNVYNHSGNRMFYFQNSTDAINVEIKNGNFECHWLSGNWNGPVGPVRFNCPNGKLTISDISFTGEGGNTYNAIKVVSANECVLNNVNGVMEGDCGCFENVSSCVAVLNNCSFHAKYLGTQIDPFQRNYCACPVCVGDGGNVIINGGSYTCDSNSAILTIWDSGGKITVNNNAVLTYNRKDSLPVGPAIRVSNYYNGEYPVTPSNVILNSAQVTVPQPTIEGDLKMIYTLVGNDSATPLRSDCSVVINNGTYTNFGVCVNPSYAEELPVNCNGGFYDKDITSELNVHIPSTKYCAYDENIGKWTIVPKIKHIKSLDDLETLKNEVNAGDNKEYWTYIQDVNLDMDGIIWTGIGTSDTLESGSGFKAFAGTYDGNGKNITNLYMAPGKFRGLFNAVKGGTIKNLNVTTTGIVKVESEEEFASKSDFPSVGEYNKLYKVTGGDSYRWTSESYQDEVGAATLAGQLVDGACIENCVANGVLGTEENPLTYSSGGLVVRILGNNVSDYTNATRIISSVNNTNVYTKKNKAGGLTGTITGDSGIQKIFFKDCVNNGNITSTSTSSSECGAGGIIGWAGNYTHVYVDGFKNTGVIKHGNTNLSSQMIAWAHQQNIIKGDIYLRTDIPLIGSTITIDESSTVNMTLAKKVEDNVCKLLMKVDSGIVDSTDYYAMNKVTSATKNLTLNSGTVNVHYLLGNYSGTVSDSASNPITPVDDTENKVKIYTI